MRSSFRIFAGALPASFACLASMLFSHAARAQEAEPNEPVVLVYRAPASCPTEGAFLGEVRQRTTRLRAPQAGESFRRFTVEIRVARRETRGRLSIRDEGGESSRAVTGENCDEVASALALAVAIAVDPTVSLGAPLGVPAADAQIANRESRTAPPPPPARPKEVAKASIPPPPPPPKRRFRAALAASGLVATGVAPGALWGAGLATTWSAPLSFEPSLRVSIDYLGGALEAVDAAEAQFSRWTTGIDGCPLRVRLGSVSLFPCARLEVGALRAEGQKIARATSEVRPWVAVGPSARARWTLPGHRVFVELGAAAMFPLTRDRFFFQPNVTIYRAAVLGAEASFSLGLEW